MTAEKSDNRSPSKRRRGDGGSQVPSRRSGTHAEKPERSPKDVTGINPRDMQPIDPRMPYLPPP